MANNVRFVDSLKVGAYQTDGSGGGGGSLTINNNVDNYILSATGNASIINGESNLQFNGISLGIGGASSGPRLEIIDNNSGQDLMLIRKATGNGVKVTSGGVLQLIEFSSLPTAVEGGLAYVSDNFYVGLG